MKQTRQAVCVIKQYIFLDVYGDDLKVVLGQVYNLKHLLELKTRPNKLSK
jgi:hypothetical protein